MPSEREPLSAWLERHHRSATPAEVRAVEARALAAEQRADREQRLREQADRARDNALTLAALRRDEKDRHRREKLALEQQLAMNEKWARDYKRWLEKAEQRVVELEAESPDT